MSDGLINLKFRLIRNNIRKEIAKAYYVGEEIGFYSSNGNKLSSEFIKRKELEFENIYEFDNVNNRYVIYADEIIKKLEL